MFKNILIVCVGNICRSPMAEALLRRGLRQLGAKAVVASAGVAALAGEPADELAQQLLRERGIDIADHRARQLTPSLITASDLILTMDNQQTRAVESIFAGARGRVHRLGKWSDFDIPDPYRGPREAFEQALSLIERGLEEWRQKVWAKQ